MRRLVLAAAVAAAVAPVPVTAFANAAECDPKGDVRCARSCLHRLDPAQAVAYASALVGCLT